MEEKTVKTEEKKFNTILDAIQFVIEKKDDLKKEIEKYSEPSNFQYFLTFPEIWISLSVDAVGNFIVDYAPKPRLTLFVCLNKIEFLISNFSVDKNLQKVWIKEGKRNCDTLLISHYSVRKNVPSIKLNLYSGQIPSKPIVVEEEFLSYFLEIIKANLEKKIEIE